MKRGGPLKRSALKPGAKSLERGSTFASRADGMGRKPPEPALSDRVAARRAERARRHAARMAAERSTPRVEWDVRTRASVCAVCGSDVSVTGHHIIPLRILKTEGVDRGLWYDQRNNLPLCDEPSPRRCHKRHELHVVRVPRDVVLAKAPAATAFADEVGLLHVFDREYPVIPRQAS